MARSQRSPTGTVQRVLHVQSLSCPECGNGMWSAYVSVRTVRTLLGVHGLRLHVRFCVNKACRRYRVPYRPEEEGRIALPQYEFGLDVIALVGALRYQHHRSVPEIHQDLAARGLVVCERTVTNLLDRYDELLALRLSDSKRLKRITARQKRVILSLDGLQPDVGHEVLWVLRDCLSGEVLLARSLLSSTEADLGADYRGQTGPVGPDCGGDLRWSALDSQRGGQRLAWNTSSTVSLPLPSGGGQADLRGGSPR